MKKLIIIAGSIVAALSVNAQQLDSLDIKIGQMILVGMPKAEVDEAVLKEVREGKVGSIIYFEKNIPKTNSFAGLKKMSWVYQNAAPIPLFISIDQEGGKVNRMKEKYGFPRSITAAAMGKKNALDSARFYGETTASALVGVGINVNFAPVVDLASNPNNPVIAKSERAFSASADTVTLAAREFIKAHRKLGVVTVLKHFPGHGSSMDDSHFGIADVTKTWQKNELVPYQNLINSGYVDAIMTAHIVNFKLDKRGYPGTLSYSIIDSLLRKRMHYQGVIFSDDMQMHAITKNYGLEEAIRLSIIAGVDILTFSNNIQGSETRTVDKVHAIIRKFVETGAIKKERIDESFKRIMDLKMKLIAPADVYYPKKLAEMQKQLDKKSQELDSVNNAIRVKENVSKNNSSTTTDSSAKKKKKRKK